MASIAVVLAPHLGAGAQIAAAAVAVTLSVIGQVGLKEWCLTQTERRRTRGTGGHATSRLVSGAPSTRAPWAEQIVLFRRPDLSGQYFPLAARAIELILRRRPLRPGGRWCTVTVYAITSLTAFQADPALLAGWIRGHCGIENRLHWVRDVSVDEDRSQVRTAAGPQVMAARRNLAITALRLAGITTIAAAPRHHARDVLRPLAA